MGNKLASPQCVKLALHLLGESKENVNKKEPQSCIEPLMP